MPNTLTEYDAAIAYADAWNSLDCTGFTSLLASDAQHTSQCTFYEIDGRDDVTDYICDKFQSCKTDDSNIKAIVSIATKIAPGKSCVLLIQGSHNTVVLFETRANEIFRINICITEIYNPLPLSADGQSVSAWIYKRIPPVTLEERLGALSQMHANKIALSGKSASGYCWSNDGEATNMLQNKLETGCAHAMIAKTANANNRKRYEALDLYIEACKQASIALEQVFSALDSIEDSV